MERAHANSEANGCQHATPFEYLDGILKMVRKVGSHLEDFKFIVAQMRTDPRSSSPNWQFVRESERTIQTALQVQRGSQAYTQGEYDGFLANVATTPGRKVTPATGAEKVQVSTPTQAPEEETEPRTAQGRGGG